MANNETEVLVPGSSPAQLELEQANHKFQAQVTDHISAKGGSLNIDDRWFKTPSIEHLPGFGIYEGDHKVTPPTPEEIKKAQENADGSISKLLSPEYKQTLQSMQDSLLSGDAKGFAKAIESLRNDPERLKAFIDEMNKNMEKAGTNARAAVDKAGNVVIYDDGNRGVEIGKDGSTTVRAIDHGLDGSIVMGGEVLNANGDKAMKNIGNGAVNSINSTELKPSWPEIGLKPNHPHWPGIEEDPGVILLKRLQRYDPLDDPRQYLMMDSGAAHMDSGTAHKE